jgi:hypothetical protein
MRRVAAFCGDVAGLLLAGLFVPVAVLIVGIPVALAVKLVLTLFEGS